MSASDAAGFAKSECFITLVDVRCRITADQRHFERKIGGLWYDAYGSVCDFMIVDGFPRIFKRPERDAITWRRSSSPRSSRKVFLECPQIKRAPSLDQAAEFGQDLAGLGGTRAAFKGSELQQP
ncbi:hypothetical protein GGD65_006374 [Bradyrhizobium sp. CIR18]|uniref:hypothetical protein n=1 Tax=Bradyrhizobium sp. CIR18 TaxID=2663839 RepID=UPI0016057860|nr:hypothetical protein [Bradyrhizobium sp. CIR18]MBB4365308.1 hypothetical protein [Bradyrhizobium sp. CIR18]